MSISPLTSILSTLSSPQSSQNNRRQDFTELANALQSGNLQGAQQAYAQLEQSQGAQSASSSSSSNNPITADFAALGKALSSGDLSQAQSAFSQLQSDLKTAQGTQQQGSQATEARGHRHHHHADADTDANAATSSSTSASDTTASTPTTGTINVVG